MKPSIDLVGHAKCQAVSKVDADQSIRLMAPDKAVTIRTPNDLQLLGVLTTLKG
jgi:hypothetical protein